MHTVPATAIQNAMPILHFSPKTNAFDSPEQYSFLTILLPHPAGYAISPEVEIDIILLAYIATATNRKVPPAFVSK